MISWKDQQNPFLGGCSSCRWDVAEIHWNSNYCYYLSLGRVKGVKKQSPDCCRSFYRRRDQVIFGVCWWGLRFWSMLLFCCWWWWWWWSSSSSSSSSVNLAKNVLWRSEVSALLAQFLHTLCAPKPDDDADDDDGRGFIPVDSNQNGCWVQCRDGDISFGRLKFQSVSGGNRWQPTLLIW